MKRLGVVAAVGLAMLSAPAWSAQTISLNARSSGDLAALCAADPSTPAADAKINYCHGFAQGAVDAWLRLSADKKPFCFPSPTPTRAATMKEFVTWVRALPSNRDMPVLDGLFKFFGERFPCR